MTGLDGFRHEVASHCESGSMRNLLRHAGLTLSEPMAFGLGSGPLFYYLFFAKGPSRFPLLGIRNPPGSMARNIGKLCGVEMERRQFRTPREALAEADRQLAAGSPVGAIVDMFFMKYLPSFLRVHAPFHFIVLFGKEGRRYRVSDPYAEEVGTVEEEDLEAAWATHAPLSKDNLMIRVVRVPAEVDWKSATRRAMLRTSREMVLPTPFRQLFFFVGVQGMRTFARALARWPDTYRGSVLRDGMMFNAIAFEDQGTGGAAFRLMYASFLQEAAEIHGSQELRDLARRLIEHGRRWRAASRRIVVLAKPLPMKDEEYPDWMAQHGRELREGLAGLSRQWLEFADFEQAFFRDLRKTAARLA